MRLVIPVLAVSALLVACGRSVEHTVTVGGGPATLACATRAAQGHGYSPSQEVASARAPRLARPLFGKEGDPSFTGPDRHHTDYLTITLDGDSLRFIAVGNDLQGKELAPSPRTVAHVQEIVTACASS